MSFVVIRCDKCGESPPDYSQDDAIHGVEPDGDCAYCGARDWRFDAIDADEAEAMGLDAGDADGDDDAECPNCGAYVGAEGEELLDDAYCPECGEWLEYFF